MKLGICGRGKRRGSSDCSDETSTVDRDERVTEASRPYRDHEYGKSSVEGTWLSLFLSVSLLSTCMHASLERMTVKMCLDSDIFRCRINVFRLLKSYGNVVRKILSNLGQE